MAARSERPTRSSLTHSSATYLCEPLLLDDLYTDEIGRAGVFRFSRSSSGTSDSRWTGNSRHESPELSRSSFRVLVFPEGSRTLDGTLQPPLPGVGFVIAKTLAPVVPMRIFGAHEALPRGGGR